jgi:hypothetical protein
MTHYILDANKFVATATNEDWDAGQGYDTRADAEEAARVLAKDNPKERYTIVEAVAEVYTPATNARVKSL